MNAAHKLLRDGTADRHARVDAAFSAFDLTKIEGYGDFLKAQAKAYLPVEDALDQAAAADLLPDWPSRKRGDALRDDMVCLGIAMPDLAAAPAFGDAGEIWGALYVIEGSRLGGRLLVRSVPDGLPAKFLTHTVQKSTWRSLLGRLDLSLDNDNARQKAVVAARTVFDLFESAAMAVKGTSLRE